MGEMWDFDDDLNDSGKSGNTKKMLLWRVLLTVCAVGAVFTVGSLAYRTLRSWHEEQILKQLANQTVESGPPTPVPAETPRPPEPSVTPEPVKEKSWDQLTREEKIQKLEEFFAIDIPDKKIDFAALQEETNSDIYAWIYIPDTKIDYPVLQHPDDNLYYLNYNIDGTKGYPGCIYTENYNAKDFSDHNTVIYGHNMKNGTMFAGLHQFEDSDFFAEHPYVYIYAEDEVYIAQVFAAYEFSDVHLLNAYSTDTEIGFGIYLDEVMDVRSMNGNFDSDIEVTGQDRILTLSTCISGKPDNRYLVQGVLLQINET